VREEINGLQERLNVALLRSDVETLSQLVAPEARIVGPRGFLISREAWIGVRMDGQYQQARLDTSETEVTAYEGTAIRVDVVDSECRLRGETIAGRFRVMQVWIKNGERWQLTGIQYTGLSAPGQ
jgi:hypothetical protein